MDMRTKIRGAALGVAIGDRMGMPVEMYTSAKIAEVFPETGGRVSSYLFPRNHKFFKNDDNETTDDWDFTQATFEGLSLAKNLSLNEMMRSQVEQNVRIYTERKARGCGGTTRKAMDALIGGWHWSISAPRGNTDGSGNGVAMKIMPVAAVSAIGYDLGNPFDGLPVSMADAEYERFIVACTLMTHAKSVAVSTTLAMVEAYKYCFLEYHPSLFNVPEFVSKVVSGSARGMTTLPETITDNATARLALLIDHANYDTKRIVTDFGGGGCYCYHSIPFSLMFFVKNPLSIETMYDVISAGGDTDSNGSMVGGLLGALHGESIFPPELVEGLYNKNLVLEVADRFCDKFGL